MSCTFGIGKMKKKTENLVVGIGIGIFIVLIISIFVYLFFMLSSKDTIAYSIGIDNNKKVRGEDITMFYDIHNNYQKDIKNVNFTVSLPGKMIPKSNIIDNILPGEKYSNVIIFKTQGLSKGAYSFYTTIEWKDPIDNKTRSDELSLSFEIYEPQTKKDSSSVTVQVPTVPTYVL